MSVITTRAGKGSPLTNAEVDANFTGLNNGKEETANKGVANGYAGLDVSGKVPASQLPSYVDDVLEYANLAAFPGTGEAGKIYIAMDNSRTYRWSGSVYSAIAAGSVDSVAGRTGVVTLVKADVGLGNVDNTSDASKPVSTAQQAAINLKADSASPAFSTKTTVSHAGSPTIDLFNTSGAAGQKYARWKYTGGSYSLEYLNDAYSAVTSVPIQIDSAGNVGVGIAPSYRLHVQNDASGATTWIAAKNAAAAGAYGAGFIGMAGASNNYFTLAETAAGDCQLNNVGGASGKIQLFNNGAERFHIGGAGQLGIAGANYGTSGQVLTSNGAAAAPSWQTPSGGSYVAKDNGSGAVGSFILGVTNYGGGVANGGAIPGSNLVVWTSGTTGGSLSGTWRNVSGLSISGDLGMYGLWQRIA